MFKAWRWLCAAVFVLAAWVAWSGYQPLQVGAGVQIEVRHGDSLYALTHRLGERGILPGAWGLLLYEHLSARDVRLVAGVYPLQKGLDGWGLLRLLSDSPGRYVQRVTLVEGMTWQMLEQRLHQQADLVWPAGSGDWTAALAPTGGRLEGWLAPDTYGYVPGLPVRVLLASMLHRQQKLLAVAWAGRDPGLPYQSPYQALIMASLIEKETGATEERRHIAGVFVHRLRLGMRLQTDPSVIYGLGETYHGRLRSADLRTPTPYNTYCIQGLPPTPIAMPGRAALWAAVHPLSTDDLYFVARGDGHHVFSATLPEQNAAVQRYQRHRRADYRSHL